MENLEIDYTQNSFPISIALALNVSTATAAAIFSRMM